MMNTLSRDLRKELERAVVAARRAATGGARKAVMSLAVHEARPYGGISEPQKKLRNRLRAHGRQLGDALDAKKETQEIEHLIAECAYEHWHRMLFARFLAENDLLIHPEYGAPISLEECRGLARSRGVGWVELAAEYAEGMLPQIFRRGDPVLDVVLPPEARHELEQLLEALPREVFTADDSLGWTYQFWQTEVKDEVNRSGKKIGADELAPVTQLFTEDYMVLFLLHNTLGAWWAAKCCPEGVVAGSEEEARAACALPGVDWSYLRFVQDEGSDRWRPAAGAFEAWPRAAKSLTLLDPCMGSGHFLVFALPILAALRMAEEGLTGTEAVNAILRDNLYGLELDQRCTQIAAFNLALAAWKLTGYRHLPALHLACSGLAIYADEYEWTQLGSDEQQRGAMRELYRLFGASDTLGSLVNPRRLRSDLFSGSYRDVHALLNKALNAERADEFASELAVRARGVIDAGGILAREFTLVVTNVPFLGRGKQAATLKHYCERYHRAAKADLAACFIERCLDFCSPGGTSAIVSPQTWLFLGAFKGLRKQLLSNVSFNVISRLGPAAFQDMNWWAATTLLTCISREAATEASCYASIDAASSREPREKARLLASAGILRVEQLSQLRNPDATISDVSTDQARVLGVYAACSQGIGTADANRHILKFWEVNNWGDTWEPYQMAPEASTLISGCHSVLRWERGKGVLARSRQARICGQPAWGKHGAAISVTGHLYRSLYLGLKFDCTLAAVTAIREEDQAAVIRFALDQSFVGAVRQVDQALSVTESSFLKVPFDLEYWAGAARRESPDGLPLPSSDDPTQWLFSGRPSAARAPLHVAVARLVGYRWPVETGLIGSGTARVEVDEIEPHVDDDGVVPLVAIHQEGSAGDRLRALLASALGTRWSMVEHERLLTQVGYQGQSINDWLRDGFFEQHCDLFHDRPFVWHIWDGLRDGFGALVNYHRLTAPRGQGRKLLEKLTHTYLGDWIARQRADQRSGVAGADNRLAAAQHLQHELEKIIQGEPPYDIFVRWKPLQEQPIGWEPDLNDGVRINIRPFMMAKTLGARGKKSCILRFTPNINWRKDRGSEPERPKEDFPSFWNWDGKTQDFEGGREFDGARWNDLHYTRAFKQAARERHAKAKSR